MGRTRTFDVARTLEIASEVFATKGFEGTSIDDLIVALGVHRGSLYQAFGSKRGLYLAALTHYLDRLAERLADGSASVEELVSGSELDFLLMCAADRGAIDIDVAERVRRGFTLLNEAAPGLTSVVGPSWIELHGTPGELRAGMVLLSRRLFARLTVAA